MKTMVVLGGVVKTVVMKMPVMVVIDGGDGDGGRLHRTGFLG